MIVAAGPLATYGSRFARNVILSRLLAPEEFGAALAISVMLGLVNQVTDVALDRFVMIEGSRSSLSTAHSLSILRSILVAGIIVLLAPEISATFGLESDWKSFAVAGALSAIGGFANLGVKQVQLRHDYAPEAFSQLIGNLTAVIALFPAVRLMHDHRAIILSYLVEWSGYVAASHLLSKSKYRIHPQKPIVKRALSFGIPLVINGIGLALIYQCDRVLVGHWFGVKELASYSVIFSLSVMPTSIMLGVFGNVSLSYILASPVGSPERDQRYRFLIFFFGIIATISVSVLSFSLDIVTPIVFGPAYEVARVQQVLFATIAFLRLQRSGAPTIRCWRAGAPERWRSLTFCRHGINLRLDWHTIRAAHYRDFLVGLVIGEFAAYALSFARAQNSVENRANLALLISITLPALALIISLLMTKNHGSASFHGMVLVAGRFPLQFKRPCDCVLASDFFRPYRRECPAKAKTSCSSGATSKTNCAAAHVGVACGGANLRSIGPDSPWRSPI